MINKSVDCRKHSFKNGINGLLKGRGGGLFTRFNSANSSVHHAVNTRNHAVNTRIIPTGVLKCGFRGSNPPPEIFSFFEN